MDTISSVPAFISLDGPASVVQKGGVDSPVFCPHDSTIVRADGLFDERSDRETSPNGRSSYNDPGARRAKRFLLAKSRVEPNRVLLA